MTRPQRRRRGGGRGGRPGESWAEHVVADDEAGRTLQEILTGSMGVSRRMIQRLTRASGIRLNGRPSFLGRPVRAGDRVAARIAADEAAAVEPVAMPLSIVYEDDHLLVVDKPAGLLVHPVGRGGEATLVHGITHHLLQAGVRARVRPVHRLDRGTSGLLVVARTAFVHQALDRQLRERRMHRRYLAFVEGVPPFGEQVVDASIGAHASDPNLRAVNPAGDRARTRLRVIERYGDAALIEAELETGRTHQIRVHLSHLGHPLIGDERYGAGRSALGRQALHAAEVRFQHPRSGESLELRSPLPAELVELRRRCRGEGRGGGGQE